MERSMESDETTVSSPTRDSRATRAGGGGTVFWKELYWFTILSIVGASLVLWILPARAARHQSLLDLELDLRTKNAHR